jgi:hypothetical protein
VSSFRMIDGTQGDPLHQLRWIGWFAVVFAALGLVFVGFDVWLWVAALNEPASLGNLAGMRSGLGGRLHSANVAALAAHSSYFCVVGWLCTRGARTAGRAAALGGGLGLLGSCLLPGVARWFGPAGWVLFLAAPSASPVGSAVTAYITALGVAVHFEQVAASERRGARLLGRPALLAVLLFSVAQALSWALPGNTLEQHLFTASGL